MKTKTILGLAMAGLILITMGCAGTQTRGNTETVLVSPQNWVMSNTSQTYPIRQTEEYLAILVGGDGYTSFGFHTSNSLEVTFEKAIRVQRINFALWSDIPSTPDCELLRLTIAGVNVFGANDHNYYLTFIEVGDGVFTLRGPDPENIRRLEYTFPRNQEWLDVELALEGDFGKIEKIAINLSNQAPPGCFNEFRISPITAVLQGP